MLVTKEQLSVYNIDSNFWFARRTGSGSPISRDQYFINNPSKLVVGIYCAIGNDNDGWELEQFNGTNWVVSAPDETYRLVITSKGLKSLADMVTGGYKLSISGIKIIDRTVENPGIPLIEWTDKKFITYGNVVFSVGTLNAHNGPDAQGFSRVGEVLSWKYNTASGGIQYCLDLPVEGLGAISDQNEEEWDIGSIGLYIKDVDGVSDILFAVATLPSTVKKYATRPDRIGNRLKFYMNTVLSNLGFVSDLTVLPDSNHDLPEIPNESTLVYPTDPQLRQYNCYLIDNLYGSNIPAIAVPRQLKGETYQDWAYFQPSNNFVYINPDLFDSHVQNYQFVCWNSTTQKYELAQGRYFEDDPAPNPNMPIGIRVGNNIVYSGEVTNTQSTYAYSVKVYNGGSGYAIGDLLNIVVTEGLTLRVEVTDVTSNGEIVVASEDDGIALIGPTAGNIDINGTYAQQSYVAKYADTSQLPRNGNGARFLVESQMMDRYIWSFSAQDLNKPVYCDKGTNDPNNPGNAGKPTTTRTDCFLGWITGANSIRLALDLRSEASETLFGTTRYATNTEVRNPVVNPKVSISSAVTPQTLYNNYIQKTKPSNSTQAGYDWRNPIEVHTCLHFNEMILGRSIHKQGNTYDQSNSNWNDANIDFWGRAFRAEWADLAEYYESDEIYEPGTLIAFGAGDKEITKAQFEADGIISSKPGLQLGSKNGDHWLPVALIGRVPVMMDGNSINYFGDKIYLSRVRPGMASTIKNGRCLGKIIDKNPGTKRLVECVIRIDFDND